jgi:hypothetical protein
MDQVGPPRGGAPPCPAFRLLHLDWAAEAHRPTCQPSTRFHPGETGKTGHRSHSAASWMAVPLPTHRQRRFQLLLHRRLVTAARRLVPLLAALALAARERECPATATACPSQRQRRGHWRATPPPPWRWRWCVWDLLDSMYPSCNHLHVLLLQASARELHERQVAAEVQAQAQAQAGTASPSGLRARSPEAGADAGASAQAIALSAFVSLIRCFQRKSPQMRASNAASGGIAGSTLTSTGSRSGGLRAGGSKHDLPRSKSATTNVIRTAATTEGGAPSSVAGPTSAGAEAAPARAPTKSSGSIAMAVDSPSRITGVDTERSPTVSSGVGVSVSQESPGFQSTPKRPHLPAEDGDIVRVLLPIHVRPSIYGLSAVTHGIGL